MNEKQGGGLKEMRERISSYHVYDRHYERVGKVDDLFVDANDDLEYIGLALVGMFSSKTALIPMELVRINDRRDLIEIEADKSAIEASPTFAKDDEITLDYEDNVYLHFGLQNPNSSGERGSYGNYEGGEGREDADPGEVDTAYGERAGSGYAPHEPRAADGRGDSSLPSRSDPPEWNVPERGYSGASAKTEERDGSSSGSPGGAKVRRRLRVAIQREDDHADSAGNDDADDGLRIRKKTGGEDTASEGADENTDRRVR